MPIQCDPGRTCFIQHYVDIDEGPDVRDFRCGTATYEGHKGIDFRVLSAAAARRGVPVIAAAPGIVKGARDGMQDAFSRETGKAGIADRECGNGMVLDHGDGWETQYCHLRQGSVLVKRGQRVERGQKLGEVGWSGLADFAHLHLSVRKDGKVIEPFTGEGQTGTCALDKSGKGLWDDAVLAAFPYRNGEIFEVGFGDRDPSWAALEQDHEAVTRPTANSARLAFYVRLMNIKQGDIVRMSVNGPAGLKIQAETASWPKNKQVELTGVARNRKDAPWPAGTYTGIAELVRAGAVISERRSAYDLK